MLEPLVSALMVTRGSITNVENAINFFQKQTWTNKELCVVTANSDNEYLIRDRLDKADISFCFKKVSSDLSLGNLRNISMSIANGEYACTWDDDDFYGQDRLKVMMQGLLNNESAAAFLRRIILFDPARKKIALSSIRPWENTMVVRRSCAPIYPDLHSGEDTAFVNFLLKHHKIIGINAPGQYAYQKTFSNTVSESHFEALFKESSKVIQGADCKEYFLRLPCFRGWNESWC